jgi:hypothetical protein
MLGAALLAFAGALVNLVGIRNERGAEREPRRAVTPCPEAPPVESRVASGG